MGKKQQRFSREFKLEAVRLLEEGKKPAAKKKKWGRFYLIKIPSLL